MSVQLRGDGAGADESSCTPSSVTALPPWFTDRLARIARARDITELLSSTGSSGTAPEFLEEAVGSGAGAAVATGTQTDGVAAFEAQNIFVVEDVGAGAARSTYKITRRGGRSRAARDDRAASDKQPIPVSIIG